MTAEDKQSAMLGKYGLLLQALAEKGDREAIIACHRRGDLYSEPSSAVDSIHRFTFGMALQQILNGAHMADVPRSSLMSIQGNVVCSWIPGELNGIAAEEKTRDYTLSSSERTSLLLITQKAANELPDSYVCIYDSYKCALEEPVGRVRSAAVVSASFAGQTWASRFAQLKKLSATHSIILVGITPDEVEQDAVPGITSRLKRAEHRRFLASRIFELFQSGYLHC